MFRLNDVKRLIEGCFLGEADLYSVAIRFEAFNDLDITINTQAQSVLDLARCLRRVLGLYIIQGQSIL